MSTGIDTDVAVVGGGMAGIVGATVAQQHGARTIVVRSGHGATSMSSGAIDVMGYLPGSVLPLGSPAEGLSLIAGRFPTHPYAVLCQAEEQDLVVNLAPVSDSLKWLQKTLNGPEFVLTGDIERNLFPLSPLGTSKPSCLIQDTMYSSVSADMHDGVLLVAGIRGYPDFITRSVSRVLVSMARGKNFRGVVSCVIDIPGLKQPFNLSSIELARMLDADDNVLGEMAIDLQREVSKIGATRVVLPPVLGLTRPRSNRNVMCKTVGVDVSEMLAFPPSVPGLRLQNALDNAYISAGGRLVLGHSVSAIETGRDGVRLSIRAPGRESTIDAKCVIMATGKFAGGGIRANESGLSESVLNVPVVTRALRSASRLRPAQHTNRLVMTPNGHDLFSCGVAVGHDMSLLDVSTGSKLDRLFAAGSIIAGYDYISEKSGLGVALATGYAAGQSAAIRATEG